MKSQKIKNQIYFLSFLLWILSLSSCGSFNSFTLSPSLSENILGSVEELTQKEKENRCIKTEHNFSKQEKEGLYGLDCIEGKKLLIKTNLEGLFVSTTSAGEKLKLEITNKDGIIQETEAVLNVINKFYKVSYELQPNKEDDREYPFLKTLLTPEETFYGSRDHEYRIVFKILGNYLILYKASKNIEAIPHTEKTSLSKDTNGNYIRSEEGYYMVPFLGYKINYCIAQKNLDPVTQTKSYTPLCNDTIRKKDNPDYIRLVLSEKESYDYLLNQKQNILPASYFIGEDEENPIQWFYTEFKTGPVGSSRQQFNPNNSFETLKPEITTLVEFEKEETALNLKIKDDILVNQDPAPVASFKTLWKNYKMPKEKDLLINFGEREDTSQQAIKRPYALFDFNQDSNYELSQLTITENYFSIMFYSKEDDKQKVFSLLKATKISELDQESFKPKKFFNNTFIDMPNFSLLKILKRIGLDIKQYKKDWTASLFNTSKKKTVIKWHFSNETVKNSLDSEGNILNDDFYRELGREAVALWNRAFEIITRDYCLSRAEPENCKIIQVVLAEEEGDKNLGDTRYNILNLVKNDFNHEYYGLSYSSGNPSTGEILNTTSSVYINNLLKLFESSIQAYIKHEMTQNTCKENKMEPEEGVSVVSPYIKTQIQELCPEVKNFICQDNLNKLNDEKIIISECGKKISKETILHTILHEMGHSFGLGHNFKASTDKNNYYSLEEIEELFPMADDLFFQPKASSVMDYIPFYSQALTVPGKYDLATLRYLYLNQLESKEGGFFNLNIPSSTEMKEPLSENQKNKMKDYKSCGELDYEQLTYSKVKKDLFCEKHDYGSSPLEIVENSIEAINFIYKGKNPHSYLQRITRFYDESFSLVNNYFKSKNSSEGHYASLNDEKAMEDYKNTLKNNFCRQGGIKKETGECGNPASDYDLYYPIDIKVRNFFIESLFRIKSTKCDVYKEEERISLDLDSIKEILRNNSSLKPDIKSCQSPHVKDFFQREGLVFIRQKSGYETPLTEAKLIIYLLAKSDLLQNFFNRITKEYLNKDLKDSILKKGFSEYDLEMISSIIFTYRNYIDGWIDSWIDLNNTQGVIMLEENKKYFESEKYSISGVEDSSYKSFITPLNAKEAEEIFTDNLFLKETYKNWIQNQLKDKKGSQSFQEYLLERPDVLINKDYFIIPLRKEGLIAKAIGSYKQAQALLTEIEAQENFLNNLEIIEKKHLEIYIDFLEKIIFNKKTVNFIF